MHDPASTRWDELTQRYRRQLRRLDDLVGEHGREALAATGGKVRLAAPILLERLAVDAAFQREMEMLEELNVELGFPRQPAHKPSESPKSQKTKSRARKKGAKR